MFTQEDLKNLEVVFGMARQSVVQNEKELINLINFKQIIFKKIEDGSKDNPISQEAEAKSE